MRAMAESVKKQNIQAAQLLFGLCWNFAEVSEIGGRAKAEAVDIGFAVHDPDWLKARAKKLHRSVEAVHLHACDPAKFIVRLKDVAKNALQAAGRGFVRVKRDLAFALEAERTHVIQSQDVV